MTMPQAPICLVFLKRINAPNSISKNPLINTHPLWNGINGGIMAMKKSGVKKCFTPTMIYSMLKV